MLEKPPPYPPPAYRWREKRTRDFDLRVMTRAYRWREKKVIMRRRSVHLH
jgi:hypothetical protein